MNPFSKRKQRLKKEEIEAAFIKICAEYDKYIVTFLKSATLKHAFERRYRNALIESMDMERFLREEIFAVKSLFVHEQDLEKERSADLERERQKQLRKNQPDFADKVLQQFKDKIIVYPPLSFHKQASYEIIHLYGAIGEFEKNHWPLLDQFISDNQSWALRGEKKDFNNILWRFIPSGENRIPVELERYNLLLNSSETSLRDISREAQQCIKKAAFLLNDIVLSCNSIIRSGIDSSNIEKNLNFVQNIIIDFRIKDLKSQ